MFQRTLNLNNKPNYSNVFEIIHYFKIFQSFLNYFKISKDFKVFWIYFKNSKYFKYFWNNSFFENISKGTRPKCTNCVDASVLWTGPDGPVSWPFGPALFFLRRSATLWSLLKATQIQQFWNTFQYFKSSKS